MPGEVSRYEEVRRERLRKEFRPRDQSRTNKLA
jgi:hypothetical protein